MAANWPRDLSTSVALNGAQARRATPVVRFEAMDASSLVTRTVSVQAQDTSSTKSARAPTDDDEGQVVLAQEAIQINVQDVPKNITISDAAANTAANPPETVKSGSTLTWNARVRVKKYEQSDMAQNTMLITLLDSHMMAPSTSIFSLAISKKNHQNDSLPARMKLVSQLCLQPPRTHLVPLVKSNVTKE